MAAWGQWDKLGMPHLGAASSGSLWSCSKGSQGDGTVSHGHPCVLKGKKREKERKTQTQQHRKTHHHV